MTPFSTAGCRAAARALALAALASVAACRFGPSLETFQPALGPAGLEISVWTDGGRRRGELLAVRDTALLLRADRSVLLVPWRSAKRLSARDVGDFVLRGAAPAPAFRERLRLLSRFPQGMTPELERAFLDALGRDSIEVVR